MKRSVFVFIIAGILGLLPDFVVGQWESSGHHLASRMGCANCHTSIMPASTLKEKLPDLSYAGLRYQSAYVYDYLRNPIRIRKHIGPAIMPHFQLSESEALAITLFLEAQTELPESPVYPAEFRNMERNGAEAFQSSKTAMRITEDVECLSCHTMQGKGGVYGVDLATVAGRLQSDWVKRFLATPSLFGVPEETMKAVFYRLFPGYRGMTRLLPDAAGQLLSMVHRLFSMDDTTSSRLTRHYNAVRDSLPDLDEADGRKIFQAQNCGACHEISGIETKPDPPAPDLLVEGSRVLPQWIASYLERPTIIRPAGFHPGSMGRMPDFQLSPGKIDLLSGFLMDQKASAEDWEIRIPQDLTAFSREKAFTMLQERLSCLGCHRIDGIGGRSAPDLSKMENRIHPLYAFNMIRRPEQVSHGGAMPAIDMPDRYQILIFNFLYQTGMREDSTLIAVAPSKLFLPEEVSSDAAGNYKRYCASCHGETGDGLGWNAPYIEPAKSTVHSDPAAMSVRPDDTLFDGIYAGGYILNKHPFMPAFGNLLSRQEIKDLVAYIRTLCGCEGPAWSRDDKGK